MRTALRAIAMLAVMACIALLSNAFARQDLGNWKLPHDFYYTVFLAPVEANSLGTLFLTITNRPYVQFEHGTCLVRVTDDEWHLITNHYPNRIQTNSLYFYGK